MARWMAIVALLLGMGFTAYDAFSTPTRREAPVTIQMMEGGSGFPTPEAVYEGGSGFPTPEPDNR